MLTKIRSIQRHKKLAPHPWQYRLRNIGFVLSSIFVYYQIFWFDYEKMGQLPENHLLPKIQKRHQNWIKTQLGLKIEEENDDEY